MTFTEAAIKYNRVTLITLVCVALGGLVSYTTAPKSEDPGFSIKTAQVITYFPGASPERVEQLVTDKLEKKIQEMPELKDVKSSSKSGISIISVNLRDEFRGAALRPIWDNLRRKVDAVAGELPAGTVGPDVNDEFGDVFGTVISLTGEGYDYAELRDIADEVRDRLLKIPDIAKVDIHGAQEERIFVEFKPERLSELGLSPSQLQNILQSQNIVASGGALSFRAQRIVLEPTGNFQSVDDIADALIRIPGTATSVRLGEITSVVRGYIDPPRSAYHATGERGLAIAASMREGGNILTLGQDVKTLLEQMRGTYPWGVDLELAVFQTEDVQNTIDGFTMSLLQAVGIVLVCMLLFLGLRTGLVVASLIPMAMASTMVLMSFFGMGLDKVSLAALIIALGLLVDNAVVMAEATMVYMEQGKDRLEAAILAANELRGPLLISSLTTVGAFLPLALAENTMGEFLGPLAIVLAMTLLASWLLATTAVPLFCVQFLKVTPAPEGEAFGSTFYQAYRAILTWALKNRLVFLGGVVGAFVGSMMLFGYVPQRFMSDSALPSFTIELKGIPGTDIAYTTQTTREIEQWMKDELLITEDRKEGLSHWATYIGNAGPRFYLGHAPADASPEYAFIFAAADPPEKIPELLPKIRNYVRDNYPDLQAIVKLRASGGGSQAPVGYRLRGDDHTVLLAQAEALKERLRQVSGTVNVRDNWGLQIPKIVVDVDDAGLKRAGLTNSDVALSLTASFDGYQVTQFREGEDVIPTLLRAHLPTRGNQRKVPALNVFSQTGSGAVPLAQVARGSMSWGPSVIKRVDRSKAVEVVANLRDDVTANEVNKQVEPWLAEQASSWPAGYAFDVIGEAQTSAEANAAIGSKLYIAGFLFVFLLMLQFNSVRRSAIVMLTIPLSLIGIVLGLLVTNSYFGFMALLALLSLAGIVINNGIVLIDRIAMEIDEGRPPALAILESAQMRLRPILLTTATTIVGLLPLWFGDDPMWVPMAIGLVFGLVFATVLTLAFVPVMYSAFYRVSFKDFDYHAAKNAVAS